MPKTAQGAIKVLKKYNSFIYQNKIYDQTKRIYPRRFTSSYAKDKAFQSFIAACLDFAHE